MILVNGVQLAPKSINQYKWAYNDSFKGPIYTIPDPFWGESGTCMGISKRRFEYKVDMIFPPMGHVEEKYVEEYYTLRYIYAQAHGKLSTCSFGETEIRDWNIDQSTNEYQKWIGKYLLESPNHFESLGQYEEYKKEYREKFNDNSR